MRCEPVAERTLLVRGTRTALYAYGPDDGPTILAIHGFRGTHEGLQPLAARLGEAGYRVIVPDLPGSGASGPLPGGHDAEQYGAWLLGVTEQVPTPQLLLGHSFGSVIVAAAIAQGAAHEGVVLINPILASPLTGPKRIATAAARAYYALASVLPEALGRRLLASRWIAGLSGALMTSTPDRRERRWIREEHLRQAGAFCSRDSVLESYRATIATTVTEYAPAVTRPALVIGADRDPLSPAWALTPEASGLTGGTFHVFPNRGHLLQYAEVPALTALIAAWDRERLTAGTRRP